MVPSRLVRAAPDRLLVLVRSASSLVLVAVVICALGVASTLYFSRAREDGVTAQLNLQTAVVELHTQDRLVGQVLEGRRTPGAASAELTTSRERVATLIANTETGSLSLRERLQLGELLQHYSSAVDAQLRLADHGADDAGAYRAAEVDPAFTAVQGAMSDQLSEVRAGADRAQQLVDVGVVLAVALFMVASAVQGRRRLAEVRRQQERRSDERYRVLVDQSTDIVVVADRDGTVHYLSPSAKRLLGADTTRVDGQELLTSTHPDDRATLTAALGSARNDHGATPVELRFSADPHAHGWQVLEVTIQDMSSHPAIGGLVLTGHDITNQQALQQELEHRALHDPLTGLPNRALLADRFAQALRTARRGPDVVGLLLIDLDRFKEINDTLGHHYGDQLLIQVGSRFGEVLRESDTIARLGGDEFAVLLPELTGIEDATAVAHKLQGALRRSFNVEGVELDVEASIGVVVSGEHGADATILLQHADIAMYAAKEGNLRVSTYDPQIDAHTPQRLALLGDLRRALRIGELLLHYQPKVNLRTRAISGVEALVRWQHPERGLLQPGDFIPMAENTGLIGPLTHYVLDLALGQARRWADNGAPLQVAVNLSARNLLDDHLDQKVADLLAEHGVPAHLLKLEVTESAIMIDPTRAKDVLHRLVAQGIEVSIDDFGAGYTSLGQLKNLPITELKIDLSYVRTMDRDTRNSLIVQSVIELGHNLGLRVVAEGVENPAILARLTTYDCDVAQGYHLSRPLPADAFNSWRTAWPEQAEDALFNSPIRATTAR
ncbi:putative bifunctional diguanylate cyclase/phosphodiesterase [Pengzhenrongella phosphoraccumulans]|uniref:putative bifunctional diguanylate cyclase/phosphodiesterase n=1 Tax=Pengzhenrongella phosphoraccumulans TaxID=3114394 RepID=UPI00388FAF4A